MFQVQVFNHICDLWIFVTYLGLVFLFSIVCLSAEAQKFQILMKSNVPFFLAWVVFLVSKNSLPNVRSWRFSPVFSLRSFRVLTLPFRSVIHFEVVFCIECLVEASGRISRNGHTCLPPSRTVSEAQGHLPALGTDAAELPWVWGWEACMSTGSGTWSFPHWVAWRLCWNAFSHQWCSVLLRPYTSATSSWFPQVHRRKSSNSIPLFLLNIVLALWVLGIFIKI